MHTLVALALTFSCVAFASDESGSNRPYQKAQIIHSRFKDHTRQNLIQMAYKLPEFADKSVKGQDHMILTLQARLIQYLESLGSRQSEPIALHLIGLPGVGKTSSIDLLEKLGFPLVRIDAQHYSSATNSGSVSYRLHSALDRALRRRGSSDQPLILFIDELDKVPEIKVEAFSGSESQSKEANEEIISVLNEILTSGKYRDNDGTPDNLEFSNVMIMTAMNFSPAQIEAFSREILGVEKSFWDYTDRDLQKFDEWIRVSANSRSSVAKILARMFRFNTISRMIPDTVVAKPLYGEDMPAIVESNIEQALQRLSLGRSASEKRIHVTASSELTGFLMKVGVYAPSGARTTVKRVDTLIEQLITIALRTPFKGKSRRLLAIPRRVQLSFDAVTEEAVLNVQAEQRKGSRVEIVAHAVTRVKYDSVVGAFVLPQNLVVEIPKELLDQATENAKKRSERPATAKEIGKRRAQIVWANSNEIEAHLNSKVFDQPELAEVISKGVAGYKDALVPNVPEFEVLMGFPGTGKSEILKVAAKKIGVPIVLLNMQEYSDDGQAGADRFGEDLKSAIDEIFRTTADRKYLLVLEELDKAYEIDPSSGQLVTRPVMAHVKELLSNGYKRIGHKTNWETLRYEMVDVRGAKLYVTMNFGMDRFDFKADPRLTTPQDMMQVWQRTSQSPESIRSILASMFQPETVNRLLSQRVYVSRPITSSGYRSILTNQLEEASKELFFDKSDRNVAGVEVKLTDSYFHQYLERESVIPSEGGRQAAGAARKILKDDIKRALSAIEKKSPLSSGAIQIELDYVPGSARQKAKVTASAIRLKESAAASPVQLFEINPVLRFPPLEAYGPMDEKRLLTSVHEFGHAMAGVWAGARLEFVQIVSPSPGIGGFTKFQQPRQPTAVTMLAQILLNLGSRAMERIVLSESPMAPESVLDITPGASDDILQASKIIWNMVHQLGFDPSGGVIERSGLMGHHHDDFSHRNYLFADLPDEKVQGLAMVVRSLENFLTEELLKAHPKQWYVERISKLAAKGGMNETEFMDLIGYPDPGENQVFLGERQTLARVFGSAFQAEPQSAQEARSFIQGSGRTAEQNLSLALGKFDLLLKAHLHSESDCEILLGKASGPSGAGSSQ